jgi:WD40 repeat protein
MADVFISYSRRDAEFVQRLNNAFVGAKRVVWIDWQSIARGEDWWREIQLGIEGGDAFITVISEHWLTSEICHNELLYARQNNKRVLPVIRQQVRDEIEKRIKGTWMDTAWEQTARDNWDYVRHLNWIFFDDDAKFNQEFAALLTTLEEDQPHIKAHTRYQMDALDWERSSRNPSFLMSGDNLAFAEAWLAQSADKEPQPTPIQREYIAESRRAEDSEKAREEGRERLIRRFRLAAGALVIVGSLAVAAGVISAGQANDARAQVATANVGLATATEVARQVEVANIQIADAQVELTAVAEEVQAGRDEIESIRLARLAQQALASNESVLAVSLALAANNISNPPELAQQILSEAAYSPGVRRIFNTQTVTNVVFRPDGRTAITVSNGNTLLLWDVNTGELLRTFGETTDRVYDVVFSPDGRSALTGSDEGVNLWDVDKGEMLHAFSGTTGSVFSVAFSPDGLTVLTGSDEGMNLWDVNTGTLLRTFGGNTGAVYYVAFSLDGRTAFASSGGGLITWDIATGEALHTFTQVCCAIAFSPDSRTLISSVSNGLTLRDAATGEMLHTFQDVHVDDVVDIDFSPDGRKALSMSSDGGVFLWNVATGAALNSLYSPMGQKILSIDFGPDGRTALFGLEDSMILWDLESGAILRAFAGHEQGVTGVAFSPDGHTALSSSYDGSIILWNVDTGEILRPFVGHTDRVWNMAFSRDGNTALSGSYDGTIILWDVNAGAALNTFPVASGDAAFSPDLLTGLSGSGVGMDLWDVTTGAILRDFITRGQSVTSVAFSPDGRMALSGLFEGHVILWDVATRQRLHTLTGHHGQVSAVVFSPDGLTALSVGCPQPGMICNPQYDLILWDLTTGEALRTFPDYTEYLYAAAFSPSGRTALTASNDGLLVLRDLTTGEALRVFRGYTGAVTNVAFSADGSTILAGSLDGNLILWRIDTLPELIQWTCENRVVEFTDTQRRQYNVLDDTPICPQSVSNN